MLVWILEPELIDIGSILNRLSNCQINDIFLISIDNLPNIVGESAHRLFQSDPLIHQYMMMQPGEPLLLKKTQLATLLPLDETVQRV